MEKSEYECRIAELTEQLGEEYSEESWVDHGIFKGEYGRRTEVLFIAGLHGLVRDNDEGVTLDKLNQKIYK